MLRIHTCVCVCVCVCVCMCECGCAQAGSQTTRSHTTRTEIRKHTAHVANRALGNQAFGLQCGGEKTRPHALHQEEPASVVWRVACGVVWRGVWCGVMRRGGADESGSSKDRKKRWTLLISKMEVAEI